MPSVHQMCKPRRNLGSNKFTGNIGVLGKLTKLQTLCVGERGSWVSCMHIWYMGIIRILFVAHQMCKPRPGILVLISSLEILGSSASSPSYRRCAFGSVGFSHCACVYVPNFALIYNICFTVQNLLCCILFKKAAPNPHAGLSAITASPELSGPSASLPSYTHCAWANKGS